MFKTAVFILHNPSRWKIEALEAAGQRYRATMQELLDLFAVEHGRILEQVGDKKLTARRLADSLSKSYGGDHKSPRPIFDGALEKAASMIQSYLALKEVDDRTNYPRVSDTEQDYFNALDNFIQTAIEDDRTFIDMQSEIARLVKQTKLVVSYCRSRDFPLIRKVNNGKYYAFLPLGTTKKLLAKCDKGEFVWATTGEVFNEKRKEAVIFPLSFGEWHEKEFWTKGQPKTAEVLKIDSRYELYVSFEIPESEKVQTETFLGVDRGLINLVAPAVVDKDGKPVYSEIYSGKTLSTVIKEEVHKQRIGQKQGKKLFGHKRKNVSENICHVLTNRIVEIAKNYSSQVVMEYLGNLQGSYAKKYQQYSRIQKLLEYKLPLAGLPKPIYRGAAWTSQTCHKCGHIDPQNRGKDDNRDKFKCQNCGHENNADINASINIARKGIWKKEKGLTGEKALQEWQEYAKKFS